MVIWVAVGTVAVVGTMFTWSLAKAAGDADEKLRELTAKRFKNK